MEGKALTHLTKTCTGVALHYIINLSTAHEMWTILTTKYARAELLLNFLTIETAYNTRVLAPGEDPDLLLNDLEHLNSKLEKIDPKYNKDELILRGHIMSRLTPEYEPVQLKYSNKLETTPMINIMRDLGVIFDKMVSKTSKGGSYAMMGVSKKFQGKCFNCNMTGHRSADC
jgi:hypothetical protein